jgi:hypothetical protein
MTKTTGERSAHFHENLTRLERRLVDLSDVEGRGISFVALDLDGLHGAGHGWLGYGRSLEG